MKNLSDLLEIYAALEGDEFDAWVSFGRGLARKRKLPDNVLPLRLPQRHVVALIENVVGDGVESAADGVVSQAVGG